MRDMASMQHPTTTPSSGNVATAGAWSFFDQVYCISLAHRTDRRNEAGAQFTRVGLGERVRFWIVEKHPTHSEQGIFESHMSCLRNALQAGAETILIFEDDVQFDRFSPARLEGAVSFLTSTPGWHMFFLGCFVRNMRRTPSASVVKVRFKCGAHAYAIHADFARQLVKIPWQGVAFDDLIRDMRDQSTYALRPACAFQSDSPTDNDRLLALHRIRGMLGGFRRLQKWNEFQHYHARFLILAHVLAVLLAAALLLLWM